MITPLVTYAADGRVGIVSLNRPDKLNAISPDLKTMLVERFHEADRDPATSVVILRAEGRSFCAGYDISPNPARAARRGNALAWHESLTDDVALEMTPWEMKKPVIASVQGHCLGGGCELAMMCDLTIAADDAVFGEPEIRFSNVGPALVMPFVIRSEEHTSELQSRPHLVCRLLLEKKTNLSKQQQVSEIMRQMLTQAQTAGQYFINFFF